MTASGAGSGVRRRGWMYWLALTLVCGALGWWAGSTVGRPAASALPPAADAVYVVQQGAVGKSVSLLASGSYVQTTLARAASAGTVTALKVAAGRRVAAGEELMTIDLRPVVIAAGSTPMFRDLRRGDRGSDVAQLQQLLAGQGHAVEQNGTFGADTERSVRAWQTRHGIPADGIVRAGDIVFAAHLPIRVSPAPDVAVGAAVNPGMPLLDRIADQPTVQLHYSVDQAALNPRSGAVTVTVDGYTWHGKMDTPDQKVDGEVFIPLVTAAGAPICGDDCEKAIGVGDATLLSVTVAVVPPATGPVVPVAALVTAPDNTTTLHAEDGSTIEVRVQTVANGLAVVSGVDVGRAILVPGTGS